MDANMVTIAIDDNLFMGMWATATVRTISLSCSNIPVVVMVVMVVVVMVWATVVANVIVFAIDHNLLMMILETDMIVISIDNNFVVASRTFVAGRWGPIMRYAP